jgi:hypothetical protein
VHPALCSAASTAGESSGSAYVTAHVGPPILTLPPVSRSFSPVLASTQADRAVSADDLTPSALIDGSPRPRFSSIAGMSGGDANGTDVRITGDLGDGLQSRKLRSRSVDSGAVESQSAVFGGRDRAAGSVVSIEGHGLIAQPGAASGEPASATSTSNPARQCSTTPLGAPTGTSLLEMTSFGVPVSQAGVTESDGGTGESAPRQSSLLPPPMLGSLLLEFLFYYSKVFHPYELGVSVLLGYVCCLGLGPFDRDVLVRCLRDFVCLSPGLRSPSIDFSPCSWIQS